MNCKYGCVLRVTEDWIYTVQTVLHGTFWSGDVVLLSFITPHKVVCFSQCNC